MISKDRRSRTLAWYALIVVIFAWPARLEAQRAPLAQGPRVEDSAERALCALKRPARIYMYGWTAVLGSLLVAQGSLALTVGGADEAHRAARTGYIVGAGLSSVALAFVLASRGEAYGCGALEAMADDTAEQRARRRVAAETALVAASRSVRRQTAWWVHGLGVALGVGMGLGLGLGYRHNAVRATAQGVGAVVFTELRLWTRPKRAIAYARPYLR